MPSDLPARLIEAARAQHEADEFAMRRLAGWMTAAAAAVLVFAIVQPLLKQHISEPTQTAQMTSSTDVDLLAVMPVDRPADEGSSGELVQVAQWMARDLSFEPRH